MPARQVRDFPQGLHEELLACLSRRSQTAHHGYLAAKGTGVEGCSTAKIASVTKQGGGENGSALAVGDAARLVQVDWLSPERGLRAH